MTKEELITFTSEIKEHWEVGRIHCPWHACGGNEEQLIEYFTRVKLNDWCFSTWRNNYHWLLKTNDADFLRHKILIENNSMHIIDLDRKFISTAIVGGNCAPAVGVAKAIKLKGGTNHVHLFCGDGCADEGFFWEALRYAQGQDLPITFVIENNNRSVCTPVKDRWGDNDTWIEKLKNEPKVYYYEYEAVYPHCGTGQFVRLM